MADEQLRMTFEGLSPDDRAKVETLKARLGLREDGALFAEMLGFFEWGMKVAETGEHPTARAHSNVYAAADLPPAMSKFRLFAMYQRDSRRALPPPKKTKLRIVSSDKDGG